MKSILELNDKKVPVVPVDKDLNKYANVVLFPEKVEKAKKAFQKFGLPDLNKHSGLQGLGTTCSAKAGNKTEE
jgi:hypothetical protein